MQAPVPHLFPCSVPLSTGTITAALISVLVHVTLLMTGQYSQAVAAVTLLDDNLKELGT